MKIEFTKQQVYNLLFELITAQSSEQQRLEDVFRVGCNKEVIEYQQLCVTRTGELISIIEKALTTPFD